MLSRPEKLKCGAHVPAKLGLHRLSVASRRCCSAGVLWSALHDAGRASRAVTQRFAARGVCVARRGSDACSSAAQVTERFAFNRDTSMQRRDLRGGEQRARLRATEAGLLASISWGEPHAGG